MDNEQPQPAPRNTYGVPIFLGALIGACSQPLVSAFPDWALIIVLAVIAVLTMLTSACNRR